VLRWEPMKEGQKVVCVDDAAPAHLRAHYTSWIRKGTVYVIRGVFLGVDYQSASPGEVGVYLLGLHNPKSNVPPFPERGFNSQRFRPIEDHPVRVEKEEEAEV
jgi:hypothetical protein